MQNDFHTRLAEMIRCGNVPAVNILISKELGRIIEDKRKDFVDLLNEGGIVAGENMPEWELVKLYVDNICDEKGNLNKKLILGTALLVNMHNKMSSADGKGIVSDEGVKTCYDFVCNHYSNAGGIGGILSGLGGGDGGSGGGAIGKGLDIIKGFRDQSAGGQSAALMEMAKKKADTKNAIVTSILEQRKAQAVAAQKAADAKAKTKKILVITGVSLLLIAAGVTAFIIIKKKRANG